MTDYTCSIGLDFGSLSCRGIVADIENGTIIAESEYKYPHGVMEDHLPDGASIPRGVVLQHPGDYLNALKHVLNELTEKVSPQHICALGVDTTASTVIPVDRDMKPMCFHQKYSSDIHAWPKMWKHHAIAQSVSLTKVLNDADSEILKRYGGSIGAEFFLPKVMEVCADDPVLFADTETFIELGDWIVSILAGSEIRSGSMLSCKAAWRPEKGYPDSTVFSSAGPEYIGLDSRLAFRPGAAAKVVWPGQNAGTVCSDAAKEYNLSEHIVLTAAQMDSYAGVTGCGVAQSGELHITLGTSNTFLILSDSFSSVPGICASVENSLYPGFTTFAAGQSGAGDVFQWFTEKCVPGQYKIRADRAGMDIHRFLCSLAEPLSPGETGLLCLEWFNGNKSILLDASLSGMILGMTLSTKPEHIYRALIEATAFGARRIIENYEENGVPVKSVIVSGGIAHKNRMLMQIYADVIGKELKVSGCHQAAALGASIYGAAAVIGDSSVTDTVSRMAGGITDCFYPDSTNMGKYDALYREYLILHDYFGNGGNKVMKRMREIQNESVS